ncbi:hypothetical protein PVAND_014773 [Polypedilum vanderplanki]|uniref:Bulb-type lectin domain-containing protein n=1 Tax=Polypedilum vanderplanki TaxID=319348 RepID=A0A9J6BB58_POLVA|nr:hypothetical protein PVAND_014773 [Polypedilum vanderplanki]
MKLKEFFAFFFLTLFINQISSKSTFLDRNEEKELIRFGRSTNDSEDEDAFDESDENESYEDESDVDKDDESDYKNEIHVGKSIKKGEMLTSPNDCFNLIFKRDGNLILRKRSNGAILWHSNTRTKCQSRAFLRMDANLVIYGCNDKIIYETGSYGENIPFVHLKLQNDGNLVIYAYEKEAKKAIWASNTLSEC